MVTLHVHAEDDDAVDALVVPLGSIRRFVDSQKRAEQNGEPACAACGKRGELHHDLEDGLMKCFSCCDMPE